MLQEELMCTTEGADHGTVNNAEYCSHEDAAICETVPDSVNQSNCVQLHLQTAGLAVQLRTQPSVTSLIELSTKVDMLSEQLQQANARLEQALHRIGYLEAKLEYKDVQIDVLLRDHS